MKMKIKIKGKERMRVKEITKARIRIVAKNQVNQKIKSEQM